MQWIRRHKIFITVLAVILLLLLTAFSYIWSKLSLIQYDLTDLPPETSAGTETVSADTADPAGEETETALPEIPAEEETEEEIILRAEDVPELSFTETEPVLPEAPAEQDDDILNILLLGTDERSQEGFSTNARSDSMILASINKSTQEIKLVSLERGMGVPVLEGEYKGQYDWLTHIFRYGGAKLLLKTVQTCFSVDVDRYIRVNFNTLKAAVDAIGGVDIEMTEAEVEYLNRAYGKYLETENKPLLAAGKNHLDGTLSLAYARLRAIDSDWSRVQRQRNLIIAGMAQVKAAGLRGLDTLANEVLPLVQTNFTKLELAELLLLAPGFLNADVDQMTLPVKDTYGLMTGMGGRTLYAVDFEANAKILHDYLYGSED
ncbi:MAG: LCP family protein [Clostridia bacterium]|nr:LCP family protein [Clostridia bacterium]